MQHASWEAHSHILHQYSQGLCYATKEYVRGDDGFAMPSIYPWPHLVPGWIGKSFRGGILSFTWSSPLASAKPLILWFGLKTCPCKAEKIIMEINESWLCLLLDSQPILWQTFCTTDIKKNCASFHNRIIKWAQKLNWWNYGNCWELSEMSETKNAYLPKISILLKFGGWDIGPFILQWLHTNPSNFALVLNI